MLTFRIRNTDEKENRGSVGIREREIDREGFVKENGQWRRSLEDSIDLFQNAAFEIVDGKCWTTTLVQSNEPFMCEIPNPKPVSELTKTR